MATEKEMYELLGRMITETEFRAALIADPTKAAAGLGIQLTEEQAAAVQATDMAEVAQGLDERLSKARGPSAGW